MGEYQTTIFGIHSINWGKLPIAADGIICDEVEQVAAALNLMANVNVDFLDAYLAEIARRGGESVVSFDKDFRRLQVNWIEPN